MCFKSEVRRSIIVITALAVVSSFFTGCGPAHDIGDNDVYGSDLPALVDDSNSDIDFVIGNSMPEDSAPTDPDTSGVSGTSTGDITDPVQPDDTSTEDASEPDNNTSTVYISDPGVPNKDPDTPGNTSESGTGDTEDNSTSSDSGGTPSSSSNTIPNNTSPPLQPAGEVFISPEDIIFMG